MSKSVNLCWRIDPWIGYRGCIYRYHKLLVSSNSSLFLLRTWVLPSYKNVILNHWPFNTVRIMWDVGIHLINNILVLFPQFIFSHILLSKRANPNHRTRIVFNFRRWNLSTKISPPSQRYFLVKIDPTCYIEIYKFYLNFINIKIYNFLLLYFKEYAFTFELKQKKNKKQKMFPPTRLWWAWPSTGLAIVDLFLADLPLLSCNCLIWIGYFCLQTSYFNRHANIYMYHNHIGRMNENASEKIKKTISKTQIVL